MLQYFYFSSCEYYLACHFVFYELLCNISYVILAMLYYMECLEMKVKNVFPLSLLLCQTATTGWSKKWIPSFIFGITLII